MKSNCKLKSEWRHLSPDEKYDRLMNLLMKLNLSGLYYVYIIRRFGGPNSEQFKVKNVRSFLLTRGYDYNQLCNIAYDLYEDMFEIAHTPWLDV